MKYLLMMNTMKLGSPAFPGWQKEDIAGHIKYMVNLYKDLNAAGELITAEGLTPPEQARLVRARKDGTPDTDGIFPEGKEFLAGFWIIDVESPERAYAVAATASAAPGAGGLPMNMPIEVRQVMSGPPPEFL